MSKDTKVLDISSERNRDGPDYFGYYKCQIAELLLQYQEPLLFDSKNSKLTGGGSRGGVRQDVGTEHGFKVSDSLFSSGLGTTLSDFKRERLKAMLRRSVTVLSTEVDEMLGPVIKTSELQTGRRKKMHLSRLNGEESEDGVIRARKKLKVMPPSSGTSLRQNSSPSGRLTAKNFAHLHDAETTNGTTGVEQPKVNDDARFILENNNPELDEILAKFSDELSVKLGYMEQQLEELLDAVMSKCRIMTLAERRHLQKIIKGLPRKNLDRIAELVERSKPVEERSPDEIFVNLDKESNVTLWRMYYYVEAVEKAKKLALTELNLST